MALTLDAHLNPRLEALREAAHAPPSAAAWETLWGILTRWPEASARVALDYAASHLDRAWPAMLRRTPRRLQTLRRLLDARPGVVELTRHLTLGGAALTPRAALELGQHPALEQTTHLSVTGGGDGAGASAATLIQRLPHHRLLHLTLSDMLVLPTHLDATLRGARLTRLARLALTNTQLRADHLGRLGRLIPPLLHTLILDHNPLASRPLAQLADTRALTGLHTLSVAHTRVAPQALARLLIPARLPSLRRLCASHNPAWDDDVTRPSAPLVQLDALDLSHCDLQHEGNPLVYRLIERTSPARLDLSANELTGGLAALARLELPRLQTLRFADNAPTPEGIAALLGAEAVGPLEALDLGGCLLDNAGLRSLARSPRAQHLRALELRDNAFDTDGLAHLTRSPHAHNLRVLGLRGNRLDPAACARLLARSPYLTRLEQLDLRATGADCDALHPWIERRARQARVMPCTVLLDALPSAPIAAAWALRARIAVAVAQPTPDDPARAYTAPTDEGLGDVAA